MDKIEKTDFLKDLLVIVHETFEGSPEGQASAYLDHGVGLIPALAEISAAEASRHFHGTTAAAQAEHAKFYLDRIVEYLQGKGQEKVNWEQSWLIETVNEEEWNALRNAVRLSYESVLRCIAGIEKWDSDNIGDAIVIIAHTAYHLGAIRQIIKAAKQI